MAIKTNFDQERWQEHRENWTKWWNRELDRPVVVIETFEENESCRKLKEKYPGKNYPAQFSLDEPAENVVEFFQAQIESTCFHGDSWPRWWPYFGPAIMAGFLGAELNIRDDTVWYSPPEGFDFFDFDIEFDENNKWYKRIHELCETAVEKWGDEVNICFTDLIANFDVLLNFRSTDKLLMDLYDRPELMKDYIAKVRKVWKTCYQNFFEIVSKNDRGTTGWAGLWSPGKHYMLQCDFSYMIGPDMFEKFVLEDISECCEFLDDPFYHLDGRGQIPHLDMLLGIEKLRGIQWIPGAGSGEPEDYLDLLKKIKDAGKLCQLILSPEGAIKVRNELGGKGFAFHIMHEGMKPDEVQGLLDELYS